MTWRLWLRRGRGPLLPGGSGGRGIRRRIRGGGSNPSSSNQRRCHRGAISGTGGVGVVALGWGMWRLQSHRGKEPDDVSEVIGQQGLELRALGGAQCVAVVACLHFSAQARSLFFFFYPSDTRDL